MNIGFNHKRIATAEEVFIFFPEKFVPGFDYKPADPIHHFRSQKPHVIFYGLKSIALVKLKNTVTEKFTNGPMLVGYLNQLVIIKIAVKAYGGENQNVP